jgi:hypothetical protein
MATDTVFLFAEKLRIFCVKAFSENDFCAGLMSGRITSPIQMVESVANKSSLVSPAALFFDLH